VSREKLRKMPLLEKDVCKVLVKLTPGVNFMNILPAPFAPKNFKAKA
jgi:hypothetical protein